MVCAPLKNYFTAPLFAHISSRFTHFPHFLIRLLPQPLCHQLLPALSPSPSHVVISPRVHLFPLLYPLQSPLANSLLLCHHPPNFLSYTSQLPCSLLSTPSLSLTGALTPSRSLTGTRTITSFHYPRWRMRIALARALFVEPDLLLLDVGGRERAEGQGGRQRVG